MDRWAARTARRAAILKRLSARLGHALGNALLVRTIQPYLYTKNVTTLGSGARAIRDKQDARWFDSQKQQ